MAWDVEFTDEFDVWWNGLSAAEQDRIDVAVGLVEELGPNLPFPHSSQITTSRHSHMRELRVQIDGRPFRVLYAFNPERAAILLIGGDKTGDDRWYDENVPLADRLYDEHLRELDEEKRKGAT